MVILGQSHWRAFKDWRRYEPEVDFYWHLTENRYFPFEDLGNGFYYLRIRSDTFMNGIKLLVVLIAFSITFFILLGVYALPLLISVTGLILGLYLLYGHFGTKELIISRLGGYLLRLKGNKKIICEQEISNIYVRLQRKFDSVQEEHFYLVVGGYLIDDIRISRIGRNENAMRWIGKRLARNLGINYFDFDDLSIRHNVYHYRAYSCLRWKQIELATLFAEPPKSAKKSPSK